MNQALRVAIVYSGKPQIEIAIKAGIHETRLSKIVRGWVSPTDRERKAISKVLRRPEDQLFPSESVGV